MPIKLKAQVHKPKQLVKNIKIEGPREKPEFYFLSRPFDTEDVVWSSKSGHSKLENETIIELNNVKLGWTLPSF